VSERAAEPVETRCAVGHNRLRPAPAPRRTRYAALTAAGMRARWYKDAEHVGVGGDEPCAGIAAACEADAHGIVRGDAPSRAPARVSSQPPAAPAARGAGYDTQSGELEAGLTAAAADATAAERGRRGSTPIRAARDERGARDHPLLLEQHADDTGVDPPLRRPENVVVV